MRAVRLSELGQAPVVTEIDPPRPAPGELLIRVQACGLNFADLLVIEGRYQEKPALPVTMGMELAGEIVALGDGVEGFKLGQRVAAYCGFGGLQELSAVPANLCVPLPEGMPYVEAAAFQISYGTSHVALGYRAGLQPGERLLVLGASGGVGLTAVELGKLMGAEVIACARGAEKLKVCRKAGADHLLDSDSADIRAEVKALGGADVVYDPIGGTQFDAALRATNPGGRLLPLGFASGEVPQIPANYLLVKNLTVLGLYWGGYAKLRPSVLTDSFATLFDWYADGRLKPHVSHVLPLEAVHDGLELLRTRQAVGKVVISLGE